MKNTEAIRRMNGMQVGLRDKKSKEALEIAIEALKRPTSRWSRQTDTYHDYYECENCGIGVGLDDIKNFCPNCGSKMIED